MFIYINTRVGRPKQIDKIQLILAGFLSGIKCAEFVLARFRGGLNCNCLVAEGEIKEIQVMEYGLI